MKIKSAFNPEDKVVYDFDMGKIPGKIIRKVEKSEVPDYLNPNAGDYYEIEMESDATGKSKRIVWEGKLQLDSSITSAKDMRPVDEDAARDLELFIETTGDLYRYWTVPIIKNLEKKVQKGIFDYDKSLIMWQRLADEGAKRYVKELGGPGFSVATRKEVAKQLMEYYEENYMGDNPITSAKENKAEESGPHMQFKKLDEDKKAELREQIEDELEAQLNKLHVKFDVDTWDNTVEYILSFFEEDNFYNPKDAKQAVHEWYLDTKDEFPEMFEQDAGKKKIASALYNSRIQGKLIGSARKSIKSAKYIVEVGNDEIKLDNIEEANETFRQAVENNDINTSIKIYVDEGYSNKHLKLMRSERGRLTSSRKPIKSSKMFTKNNNWKYNTAVLPSSKSMLKSFFKDGSWSWDDVVALVGRINGGMPYVIFGAAGKYPHLEKGRGLFHDQTLNDIGWFTFEKYCNDNSVFNIPQARYAVLK